MDEESLQELEVDYEMDEEEKAINEERIYLANLRVQRN
jgi:hypothetical protein